jgi:hypothetical protein
MAPRSGFGYVLVLALILTSRSGSAQTAYSVSAHVGNFHVAVANYYHVPEREVLVIRERRISDDELPVVLFVAQRAHVAPARVIALRHAGRSWWDISVHFGLGPEVYYVPVTVVSGPPYGKAYGHYRKKSRNQWHTIVLSDDDIVNLVELRFISEYYGIAPERVIEARGRHRDFVTVHSEIGDRQARAGRRDDDGHDNRGRGRGNGKGHGR